MHASLPLQCHSDQSSSDLSPHDIIGAFNQGTNHAPPVEAWSDLSQRLRDNGFAGLPVLSEGLAASQSPGRHPGSWQTHGPQPPSLEALYTALDSVLTQYDRRAHLVQELLSATDMAREREAHVDGIIQSLHR